MWCKSVGFVRWLAPLLILRSVGSLFYFLSVCSLLYGIFLALGITSGIAEGLALKNVSRGQKPKVI